jgi:hypothetical protein
MPGDPGSVLTRNVMMSQGVSGAVFASPEVQERGGNVTESSISFKPFDAWTPQSDWSMSLDKGEEAQVHMCKTLSRFYMVCLSMLRVVDAMLSLD